MTARRITFIQPTYATLTPNGVELGGYMKTGLSEEAVKGRSTVPAALDSERVVCPFEVAGVRMNLAQLAHRLCSATGRHYTNNRLTMTEDRVWLEVSVATSPAPGVEEYKRGVYKFARTIRPDGVSVVDPAPLT